MLALPKEAGHPGQPLLVTLLLRLPCLGKDPQALAAVCSQLLRQSMHSEAIGVEDSAERGLERGLGDRAAL